VTTDRARRNRSWSRRLPGQHDDVALFGKRLGGLDVGRQLRELGGLAVELLEVDQSCGWAPRPGITTTNPRARAA
jgi:hypothetical protein